MSLNFTLIISQKILTVLICRTKKRGGLPISDDSIVQAMVLKKIWDGENCIMSKVKLSYGHSGQYCQCEPKVQTQLFLRYSPCRFHKNRFLVKMAAFLRAVPRACLGKIRSSQPAQRHCSQAWVCHRRYPGLTQKFKPNVSYVFHHADSTQIDSWSKWKTCLLFSPCQIHPFDCWSKWKLFCAPRRALAKSVLASLDQGHSSQVWVCHRGCPNLTQNFKPNFF